MGGEGGGDRASITRTRTHKDRGETHTQDDGRGGTRRRTEPHARADEPEANEHAHAIDMAHQRKDT